MGPLDGLKVIEIGGIGAGPFCGQMLGDLGADVIRVDRKDEPRGIVDPKYDTWNRSCRSIILDLKKPEGVEVALRILEHSDALIEGFRPGVMERLGLGPDICFGRNPKIVYGRITGWGQDGPLKYAAGHDINYLSVAGILNVLGRAGEKPVPPINLIADLGGGGMLLAFGIMCAIHEAQKSGLGQVVDAAMLDGAATLMGWIYGLWEAGLWNEQRGTNRLDSGAHFYDAYETADGKWISIGSVETQFYERLLDLAGIDDPDFEDQMNQKKWPGLKKKTEAVFKRKTRAQWSEIMEGADLCFTPVLSFEEAMKHPHNTERKTFENVGGSMQPAPAPRFSRTKPSKPKGAPEPGEHTDSVLLECGFEESQIAALKEADVIC